VPPWLEWAGSAFWYVAVVVFLVVAATESVRPASALRDSLALRWFGNFSLYAACLGLVALAAPIESATGLAGGDTERFLFAPLKRAGDGAVLIGGVLLADLLIYLVHRVEHRIFLLWRFHAVHHADRDVDVTTGLRHHPGEFVLNSFITVIVLFCLGAPAWLIPAYGLFFISASFFQHMNAALPVWLDRLLRVVLVTPDMHRIHHSVRTEDHDTNFGIVFSFWDRLFGTYRGPDGVQQPAITFGLQPFVDQPYVRLHWPWVMPFVMRREPAKWEPEVAASRDMGAS
jgi:sterol desaturase/sphingolipid hydroxylase (fatty acid hydroxylase superfamily)